MTKPVTHFSKMVQRREHTLTGTLCNRMSNASDDLNVTEHEAEVTCKFCLRMLVIRNRMRAA